LNKQEKDKVRVLIPKADKTRYKSANCRYVRFILPFVHPTNTTNF